ncbi:MAG: hypothetical protein K940chlam1_01289 [Candidatus Anoxychlamydiales bacterium]|nr:hypothetical protein [Candidatus Anoxychlamydiales bacterium]NGX36141.1 hypothetical protein [Candidatus Anoxychlamydiales bacterium]
MSSSIFLRLAKPITWTYSQVYNHPIPTTSLVAGFASYYLRQWTPETAACIGAITFASLQIAKFTFRKSSKKPKEISVEDAALQRMRTYLSQSYDAMKPILNGYAKDGAGKKTQTDKYGKKNQDFKTCCKTLGIDWANMRSVWSTKDNTTNDKRWSAFLWKADRTDRKKYVDKYGE